MDSIEPPSFSLGFDLDAEPDPNPVLIIGDDEPEPGLIVSDSDLELEPSSSSPVLKWLRRGISNINKCSAKEDVNVLLGFKEDRDDDDDDDDDIEEFSSPEDVPASTRSRFSSCSSRVSLRGSGVFTNQPSSIFRSGGKRKLLDDVPASTGSGSGSGITSVAPLFQSSTRSPLRRFQLLDSDSEDDHPFKRSRDLSGVTKSNDSVSKRKEPRSMPRTGDLLKDFPPVAVSKTQTPAQRRFQLLDSDSDEDRPSTTRDLSRVTNKNDPSSKRKESGSMPTRSPLPRFQLIDSDSDEDQPSTTRDLSRVTNKNDPSSKSKESGSMPTRSPLRMLHLVDSDSEDDHRSTRSRGLRRVTKTNDSCSKVQPSVASKPKRKVPVDLWKDFSPAAVSKIQTPALDDVCQDYFSSIKKSTSSTAQKQSSAVASTSNSGLFRQTGEFSDLSHPSPPSHRFFLHSDPRIQSLAQKRLPKFLPLGIMNERGNWREECRIDYMNQFGSNESSKSGDSSSKSCRRGQTKSKGQESSKARSSAPKNAGKRRVAAATSGSAGHWFTSSEGRKVYISKSGQEFSGQSAYRCYKKETGGGFNKSKKKRQPKKKGKK